MKPGARNQALGHAPAETHSIDDTDIDLKFELYLPDEYTERPYLRDGSEGAAQAVGQP
jgi:hypothetical protein